MKNLSAKHLALALFFLACVSTCRGCTQTDASPPNKPEVLTPTSQAQGVHPPASNPPSDTSGGRILYLVLSTLDIWVTNADGSGSINITQVAQAPIAFSFAWSRDAEQIAFDNLGQIYKVNVDGSGLTNVSGEHFSDFYPQWSPNGEWIAFTSAEKGQEGIYMMRADGSRRQIVCQQQGIPYWSPDSRNLAFVAYGGEEEGIYVVDSNGSTSRLISQRSAYASDSVIQLAWSPDGTKIVFAVSVDVTNYDLFIASLDGSGQIRLTDHPAEDRYPRWSPDSSQIVFASNRDRNWEIYKINADGSELARLTNNQVDDVEPVWSPDGSRIAFASGEWRNRQIYLMDADGSAQIPLTYDAPPKSCIDWKP